ncbi:MAG: pilin [bacterium]
MLRLRKYLNIFVIIMFLFSFVGSVAAENLQDAFGGEKNLLDKAAIEMGYNTEQSGEPQIYELLGKILTAFVSFLGVIFLILMIYGGYMWMTAHGNEQQIEKARSLITSAIIGLAIVAGSYAISYFVLSRFFSGPEQLGY